MKSGKPPLVMIHGAFVGPWSFDSFRKDPDWVAARKASEDKAGGSLTAKDGVKSMFLKATDYSPTK